MKRMNKGIITMVMALMVTAGQMMVGNVANAEVLPQNSTVTNNINLSELLPDRIAGADRFSTAVEIARELGPTSGEAILVNGMNYPDALSAGPLAAIKEAPILLTETDVLPNVTKQVLKELNIKKVTIVGGTGVVSTKVENELKSQLITVERVFGSDRFETSVKVAEKIKVVLGAPKEIVVASGLGFADALSISPIAISHKMPILLTDKNAIPSSVQNFLNANKNLDQTYVIGGTGVITDTVKSKLVSPIRLGGVDRFDTNLKVLEQFGQELYFGFTFVASGMNYADALAGSVLAGTLSGPLVLTDSTLPAATGSFVGSRLSTLSEVVAFGGTGVVPNTVIPAIKSGITADGRAVGADAGVLKIGYASGDSETSVTGNLTLPETGTNGSMILWMPSNPDIIDINGVVTRPVAADEKVSLIAIVFKGNVFHMEYYEVTVKKK